MAKKTTSKRKTKTESLNASKLALTEFAASTEVQNYMPADYTPVDLSQHKVPGDFSDYHAYNNSHGSAEQAPQGLSVMDAVPGWAWLKRWREILICVLAVTIIGMFAYIQYQRVDVKKMEVKVAKQNTVISQIKTERDIALNNAAEGKKAVLEQNEKIEEAARIRDAQQKQMKVLEQEIADWIKKGKAYTKADNVRKQQTPQTCTEVLDFLNRNTQNEASNRSGVFGGSITGWLYAQSGLQDGIRGEEGTGANGSGTASNPGPSPGNLQADSGRP